MSNNGDTSRSGDDADLARLLEELESADYSVRVHAALELSKVNLEPITAVAIYLRLLADSEGEIRGIMQTDKLPVAILRRFNARPSARILC